MHSSAVGDIPTRLLIVRMDPALDRRHQGPYSLLGIPIQHAAEELLEVVPVGAAILIRRHVRLGAQ